MGKFKKVKALVLSMCLVLSILFTGTTEVYADSIYSRFTLFLHRSDMTVYLNQTDISQFMHVIYTKMGYSDAAFEKAYDKICNDLVYKSSDASVVSFVTMTHNDEEGNKTYETSGKKVGSARVTLLGVSEGTATITVKSSVLNKTFKFKVTVKNAELDCEDDVYYDNNKYTFSMKGNATGVSYSSSDKSVAIINKKTGLVKTKKPGTTTISCVADDGKTYTYKMKVKKRGLNYTKLTTYYYTGMIKGYYTYFPLVAAGIDVKSWKSSNEKVCKVENYGRLGKLKMLGTGKTTITCTSKSGKKYTCKLTVVGGKPWGGLSKGYQPTLSTIKKHGYFKDINSVMDYGDVIITLLEYDHEIKLGNGNKPIDLTDELILHGGKLLEERYPYRNIKSAGGGDYLCFSSDNGKKIGRIWYSCYYVDWNDDSPTMLQMLEDIH